MTVFLLLSIGFNNEVRADTNFTLGETDIEVKLNGTKYLAYSGGTGTITWNSENPSIVKVEDGKITGLAIGETTITATRGSETAICSVKVIYNSIQIGGNQSNNVSKVNLVLNEHTTETLTAIVKDGKFEEVSNATVKWKSSNSSVVKIDENSGKMDAIKSGTATITAESTGVTDTCEVTVYNAPEFTDFSNAKYETSLEYTTETLKISGVTPKDNLKNNYFYT